ncbi:MAG TPA: hypothetical protein VIP09_02800 [Dehalococcoidia bacterium]
MSVSLRQVCSGLGLSGSVSICRDVWGFSDASMPAALSSGRAVPRLSVARFAQLLRGRHFHVRLIVAGSELLTNNDQDVLDYAVFRLRDIYAANGIGIAFVTRDLRTSANSAGHAAVNTSADIDNAGHDLTADGDFVPVVVPASMNVTENNPDGTVNVTLGRSPAPGPCTPRTKEGMNSAVVDISGETTGRTLAHEVGHFLGAKHPATARGGNLMAQTGAVPAGDDPFFATVINNPDRETMLGHCTIRHAIPGI